MVNTLATSIITDETHNEFSNALKLIDGTFIQWGLASVTTNASTSSAFPYKGESTVRFTEPFVDTPCILTNVRDYAGWWNSAYSSATSSSVVISIGGNQNNATKSVDWMAIGRWK